MTFTPTRTPPRSRRPRPWTTRLVVLLLAAGLAGGIRAAGAHADGDPASDYLLSQRVFFPFDLTFPAEQKARFTDFVAAANAQGFEIRIALIPDSYDLGSITPLWRKPRTYARFLGQELTYVYKQRLLVLMPNGYGFYWPGHPSKRAYAVLDTLPPPRSQANLLGSATLAVERLAAADGVTIAAREAAPSGAERHGGHQGLLVGVAAGALLLGAVLGGLALRHVRGARR